MIPFGRRLSRRGLPFAIGYLLLSAPFLSSPASATGRLVEFPAGDGTLLAGIFYEASNRPAPGVVLVHMLGRSKDEWVTLAERLRDGGASVLALDLRGHGQSRGDGAMLSLMVGDVRAAIGWLTARPGLRPGAIAVVGASLGANLAAQASATLPTVRGVALISPSLEYRGVRLDAALMRQLGDRSVWMAASRDDPYALRSVKELAVSGKPEPHLSDTRGHGTRLLEADPAVAAALVDWLRRTLVF